MEDHVRIQDTIEVQEAEVRGTGRGRGRSYPDRSELICFNCGGKGHKAPECPSENYRDGSIKTSG